MKTNKKLMVKCNQISISSKFKDDEILFAKKNKITPQKYDIYKETGSFVGVFNKNYFYEANKQEYEGYYVKYSFINKETGFVEIKQESILVPVEHANKDNHHLAEEYVKKHINGLRQIYSIMYE